MAGVGERDVDAVGHLALHAVGDGLEHRQREVDVVLGVQRVAEVQHHLGPGLAQELLGIGPARALSPLGGEAEQLAVLRGVARGVVGRAAGIALGVAGRALGELLLELGRVEQHEPGELGGRRGADDGAAEALVDEQRQEAAVVEVGVGQDDGVERRRVEAQRHVVADRLVGAALEHAAVDEDLGPAGVDEVAGPGHGPRAAEEGQLHAPIVTHPHLAGDPRGTMRACPTPSPSPSWRPPTSRPATRATGSTSLGPGACRPTRRSWKRDAEAAEAAVRGQLAAIDAEPGHGPVARRRACPGRDASRDRDRLRTRRRAAGRPPIERASCDDASAWAAAIEAGGTTLRERLEGCYGTLADDLEVDGEHLARPQILARLATEPDPARRRRLFLGLEPLWRGIDGDGVPIAGRGAAHRPSPYQALLRESRGRWAAGDSPIAANERALGLADGDVERWAVAALEAWRDAVTTPGPPARRAGDRAVGLVVAGR